MRAPLFVICPNSDAPFSVNKKSEACQPQPSLLVFVLAIEAYDLVLCLALTACFQEIVRAVTDDPQTAHFYLQGPGGTGKTFLYQTLCHYYRSQGKTLLCFASTVIADL